MIRRIRMQGNNEDELKGWVLATEPGRMIFPDSFRVTWDDIQELHAKTEKQLNNAPVQIMRATIRVGNQEAEVKG